MKRFVLASLLLAPCSSFSAVDCNFTPSVTKVGAYGSNESYLFVCGDGIVENNESYCYNLGLGTDNQAKNRYSTAMSALAANKPIRLRFFPEASCESARTNKTIPNSIWIRK